MHVFFLFYLTMNNYKITKRQHNKIIIIILSIFLFLFTLRYDLSAPPIFLYGYGRSLPLSFEYVLIYCHSDFRLTFILSLFFLWF